MRDGPSGSTNPGAGEDATSFGAWTLLWVVYLTKVFTIVLVLITVHSQEAALLLSITTWFWIGPLIAIGAAPLLFRWRLRRVRARRRALLQAEWLFSEELDGVPVPPR